MYSRAIKARGEMDRRGRKERERERESREHREGECKEEKRSDRGNTRVT